MPEPKWEECPVSGQRRFPVPGGWIYEIDWQYDNYGSCPVSSTFGCSHVFVPEEKNHA